jgi:hypothetical protein
MKKLSSLFHDEKVQDTLIVAIVLAVIVTLSVIFI